MGKTPQVWVAALSNASRRYQADITGDFMGGFGTGPGLIARYDPEEQYHLFCVMQHPCGDPRIKQPASGVGACGPGVDELKVFERLLPADHEPVAGVIGAYCQDTDGRIVMNDLVQHSLAPLCHRVPAERDYHTSREAYMCARARQVAMCTDPSVATQYTVDWLREPSEPFDEWSTPQYQLERAKVAYIPGECYAGNPEVVLEIIKMMHAVETNNVVIMTLPPLDVMAKLWPTLLIAISRVDWLIGSEDQWHFVAKKLGVECVSNPGEVLYNCREKMDRPNPKRVRTFFAHRFGVAVWVQHKPGDDTQELPRPQQSDYEGIHNTIGPSEVGDRGGLAAWVGAVLFALHKNYPFERLMSFASEIGSTMCLNTYFDLKLLDGRRDPEKNPDE